MEIVSDYFLVLHSHLNGLNVPWLDAQAPITIRGQVGIYPVIAAVTTPALTLAPPVFFGTYIKN